MPKVAGKSRAKPRSAKKPASRAGTKGRGRARKQTPEPGLFEKMGSAFNQLMHRAVSTVITYTAVVAVLAVLGIGVALFAGGYFANMGTHFSNFTRDVARAAGFEVTQVTWRGAVQTRSFEMERALYDATGQDIIGQSLLHFPARTAHERIEQLGWVRHAAVSRLWPGTVHVTIEERIPAALWQRDGSGRLYLIDREGAQITEVGAHQYTGLPLIIGTPEPASAGGVLRALAVHPELAAKVANLTRHESGRWDVGLRGGLTVLLPRTGYDRAIAQIAVLDGKGDLADRVDTLDMRNPDAVTVRPKEI